MKITYRSHFTNMRPDYAERMEYIAAMFRMYPAQPSRITLEPRC